MKDMKDRMLLLVEALQNGEISVKGFNKQMEFLTSFEKTLPEFIINSNITLVGKDLHRSRSTYIKDSKSHRRVYEMAKSQVSCINDILSSDKESKVLVIMPRVLGGFQRFSDIRTAGLQEDTQEYSDKLMSEMTDEEYEEYGIDKNNPYDCNGLRFIQEWINDRVYDKSRVRFVNGNRQIFKEKSVKDSIVHSINDGYTNICFFFKPARDNRKFKFECCKIKNRNKYSEVEFDWVSWVLNLVLENKQLNSGKYSFFFSQDYRQVVKMIKSEYNCKISENLFDEYKSTVINNRIDYIIEEEHPDEHNEEFFKLIEHFKDLTKSGIYEVEYSIQQIMKIVDYHSKPSNMWYKLNRPKYSDIFDVELLSSPDVKCRDRIVRISFKERILKIDTEINKTIEIINDDSNILDIPSDNNSEINENSEEIQNKVNACYLVNKNSQESSNKEDKQPEIKNLNLNHYNKTLIKVNNHKDKLSNSNNNLNYNKINISLITEKESINDYSINDYSINDNILPFSNKSITNKIDKNLPIKIQAELAKSNCEETFKFLERKNFEKEGVFT